MATEQTFEIISGKFNVVEIRTSGNYTYKLINKCVTISDYFLPSSQYRLKHSKGSTSQINLL